MLFLYNITLVFVCSSFIQWERVYIKSSVLRYNGSVKHLVKLICPSCKFPLEYNETMLLCSKCNKEFKIENEIFDFLDTQKSPGELFDRKLLEIALKRGVKGAMSQVPSVLRRYTYNEHRADWLFHCLDLDNTESCLDLGSGWGTVAFPLSKWYDEVWSLEKVSERVRFQI